MSKLIIALVLIFLIDAARANESATSATTERSNVTASSAYRSKVATSIRRHLHYPPNNQGKHCSVRIEQNQQGEVQLIELQDCESTELAKSLESAILKASPLPLPDDPAIFNPTLLIKF